MIAETTLKNIIYSIIAIIGNPLYIFIAYVYTIEDLEKFTQTSTNVNQISFIYYLLVLIVIFIIRLFFYQIFIIGKIDVFLTNFRFYEMFIERHKFQFLGIILFALYLIPIEGNVFGFFYLPFTILSILVINTITIIRLIKLKRKYLESYH